MFVKNYLNPTTPYRTLLLQYPTGSGKTIASLGIVIPFIIKSKLGQEIPRVNIIGFSKQIFVNELLRQPFFGFVTIEEVDELNRLQNLVKLHSLNRQVYVNYRKKLKQRLSQYFTFYGYKEFANTVLNLKETVTTKGKVSDISKDDKSNSHINTNDHVNSTSSSGKKSELKEFMSKFEGTIFICDEIHNVYNSLETNNYGLAILKVIENVKDLRLILASATITTNSRTEVLDLLPFLTSSYGNITHYDKDDFFEGKSGERELKHDAIKIIKEAIKGKVSYVEELDLTVYPERIIVGETIPGIDYLKFIRCYMSPLHLKAYDYVQKVGIDDRVPMDGRMLTDIVVPVPESDICEQDHGVGSDNKTGNNDSLCVEYLNKEVLLKLDDATPEWKQKAGVEVHDKIISGNFLKRGRIGTYSMKYKTLIDDCLTINAANDGKMLVFHPYVYGSGVTMIAEIFKANGFIDETMVAGPTTICAICGLEYSLHATPTQVSPVSEYNGVASTEHLQESHQFEPARFLLVHSEMDVLSRDNKISMYNNPRNVIGHEYKIIIGSKVIKEREDFKAVRHMFILDMPDNIPSLIQVFGRGVRRESHILLPQDKRQVYIRIYVSSRRKDNLLYDTSSPPLTYEEERYKKKISDYKVIQQIEKIFHESAIDAHLFKKISEEGLNSIPYTPDPITHDGKQVKMDWESGVGTDSYSQQHTRDTGFDLSESKKVVFQALYSRDEIDCIKYIIRRLFIEKSRIFKVSDLMFEIRNVKFYTPINPKHFLDINVRMAIHEIIYNKNKVQFPVKNFVYGLLGKSYLNSQIIKTVDGVDNVVIRIPGVDSKTENKSGGRSKGVGIMNSNQRLYSPTQGGRERYSRGTSETNGTTGSNSDYLILSVLQKPKNISNSVYGTPYKAYAGFPILDVDCWQRLIVPPDNLKINVTKLSLPYEIQRREFYLRYKETKVKHLLESINDFDMSFHEQFIREIIEYYYRLLNNQDGMSEYHDFYLSMLYIYDKFGVIIFASYIRDTQFYGMYSAYYLDKEKSKSKNSDGDYSVLVKRHSNFLSSHEKRKAKTIHLRLEKLNSLITKKKPINKVPDNYLPVGYMIKNIILYSPEQVGESTSHSSHLSNEVANMSWKSYSIDMSFSPRYSIENDIVVGFYEQSKLQLEIKFKLRPPIQLMSKFEDARRNERGTFCNSFKKGDLMLLLKKLDIKTDEIKISSICKIIKHNLIHRELEERRRYWSLSEDEQRKHPIRRWFYMHFENPDLFG